VRRVRAGAFLPAPRVDSAVLEVALYPDGRTRAPVGDLERFGQVVHAAFNQRRKTLRNAVSALVDEHAFARANINPQRRGETLSVEEFAALTDASAGHA
jgi:16S rRNA (adenine1518-N6/adenine1519-N6)-dimethyltransferase